MSFIYNKFTFSDLIKKCYIFFGIFYSILKQYYDELQVY